MGQYWIPVNLNKKEFIHPWKLGCGLKLREQVHTHPGTVAGLFILVSAQPEIRGGGDFQLSEDRYNLKSQGDAEGRTDCEEIPRSVVGRWAGDRIAIVGDYAEDSDLDPEHRASEIYNQCIAAAEGEASEWHDISEAVCEAIEAEFEIRFTGDGWRDWERTSVTA